MTLLGADGECLMTGVSCQLVFANCVSYAQLAGALGNGLVPGAGAVVDHETAAVCTWMGRSHAKQVCCMLFSSVWL